MEYISKGFREINTKSAVQTGSINSNKRAFKNLSYNHAEDQNIAPIFFRKDLIETYLESIALQNGNLMLLPSHMALLRQDHEALVDSVKILSGGATIADPLYSGSIGPGMLTGAVFGQLNKSPPSHTILEVLRVMSRKNKQGIIVLVLNNLANRLNFGSACQNAAREGIQTLLINVGEDVSGVSVSKTIGRKGFCGIKFLYKIAGAMSEEKKTLYEISHVIENLKGNALGTINVQIRPDVMVIGPGSRGESEKLFFLWDTFDDIGENARLVFVVRQALSHLFHPSSYFSLHVVKGDKIAVIVNNLGNLSDFYFSLIIKEILHQMNALGFEVSRTYSGRFLNSNLTGFSISVLKLKDNIVELLDHPVKVTCWSGKSTIAPDVPKTILDLPSTSVTYTGIQGAKTILGPKFSKQDALYLLDVLPLIVETIENMEEYLNKLDNDHDFGTAVNKFANAIKTEIENRTLKISTPYELLDQMAHLAGFTMGGVAGGIFSILLSSAAQAFLGSPPSASIHLGMWVEAARAARDGLQRFTRVQPGDGTILDALDPFVEIHTEHSVKGLSKRVTAAVKGAEATTRASRARISIEGGSVGESIVDGGTRAPDPGALCLASVIRTIFTCLQIELAEAEAAAEAQVASVAEKKRGTPRELLKGKESKHISQIKDKESKLAMQSRGDSSRHGTRIKEEVSKDATHHEDDSKNTDLKEELLQSQEHVSKYSNVNGAETKDEITKHDSQLMEQESEHDQDHKAKDSKHEKQKEQNQINLEKQAKQFQSLKDKQSEQIQELKEVFDDITKEIEDKVPDDNN